MASSSWAKKLETKLSALTDSSSKESIQTLAKWIGFNRKHGAAFGPVLKRRLQEQQHGPTLLVISQVLQLDKDGTDSSTKWDKLCDLRMLLGETVLLPLAKENVAVLNEKLTPAMIKEWDEANSFGGPTLINELKREMAATSSSSLKKDVQPLSEKEGTAAAAADDDESPLANDNEASDLNKEDVVGWGKLTSENPESEIPLETTSKPQPTLQQPTPTASKEETQQHHHVYDFESKAIPQAEVQMIQLQEPCRTVATLQIARDLKNDSAVQLSSLLSELPASVRQYMDQIKELGQEAANTQMSEDQARDLSLQTSELVVDLDIREQLDNIRIYRDIIEKQRQARQALICLLIRSRCRFGSNQAAQAFYEAKRATAELARRKQVLLDAMDLEGLELDAEDKARSDVVERELQIDDNLALPWHGTATVAASKKDNDEPPGKKARVDEGKAK